MSFERCNNELKYPQIYIYFFDIFCNKFRVHAYHTFSSRFLYIHHFSFRLNKYQSSFINNMDNNATNTVKTITTTMYIPYFLSSQSKTLFKSILLCVLFINFYETNSIAIFQRFLFSSLLASSKSMH